MTQLMAHRVHEHMQHKAVQHFSGVMASLIITFET